MSSSPVQVPPAIAKTESHASSNSIQLPLASMVRALCKAAATGSEVLYEVMLKLALMIDATAQTYGLATFSQKPGEHPLLKWVNGLDQQEIADAERYVKDAFSREEGPPEMKAGDRSICLVLAIATARREGAAIYGHCVNPLTDKQAKELRIVMDVAQLAHKHAVLRDDLYRPEESATQAATSAAATTLPGMIFVGRAMSELARSVERIKDSESTVLITGESGTGKELIARAVHRLSRRAQQPFVAFNSTAAPADLIESMLFGHRKGAFTGAHADHEGLVRAAEGGTLFLDEIGDLPLALQPKLLRFLQEGEVHTLGERAPRKVNVRVVAATHKDPESAVREGAFREDLYYRIAALSLYVPPLRERPEDTAALISHFLTHYTRRNNRAIKGITIEAIRALEGYSWPGNVRELAAEIERLVLYAEEEAYISIEDIHPRIWPANAQSTASKKPTEQSRASDQETPANLGTMIDEFERRIITETLQRCDNNVARASAALGLGSRQTLYKKLKRLDINASNLVG